MTVKNKISFWKRIKIPLILVSIFLLISSIITFTFKSISENREEARKVRLLEEKERVKSFVSKEHYITCDNMIISPKTYKVFKVKNQYFISQGDITDLNKAFKMRDCDIIIEVKD